MSKYAEDQQYLDYFKKTKEPNLSKLDYIILKLEKIQKVLNELKEK